MSLSLLDDGDATGLGPVRAVEAARAHSGDKAARGLLFAIGRRINVDGEQDISAVVADAVAECGLPASVAQAAQTTEFDDAVRASHEAGVAEIALADTIGVADPWTVRRRVEAAREAAPGTKLRMHFHDTRNTGLANAYASIEAGIDVLDAACGGLGGCPFAPNATGNIGTEDLVYMLERAGFSTGLDLDALIGIGQWISDLLGKAPTASVTRAGTFPLRTLDAVTA